MNYLCLTPVWVPCAIAFDAPLKGDGQMAPPDGISLKDHSTRDAVPRMDSKWCVQHE